MTGVWVLVGVVVVALLIALGKRWYDGRFRTLNGSADSASSSAAPGDGLTAAELGVEALGERATLVQFSSAFCAPCRATRVVLAAVAERNPGVAHVEIDAEAELGLVRRHDIMRTPTVLIVDRDGVIRGRASGAPRRDQVETALAALMTDAPDASA